ncbi:clavesin-1-like isoform X3 [Stegodyphus dumicola]|uniref:clavesin-1-like isoform X3 n=1 Tax=Stegodyphus dumicola TaxID=202533 RepID=UPI0015B14A9C|nr:clavesin-1-like isoform X3 [Stegodyphus dumicola]
MVLVPFSAEGLSPEMEAIAEKDLGETPSVRKDSLERLKKLIAARLNGKKTSIDDFIAVALTVGLLGCKLDAVSICGWVIIFDAKDFSVADLFKFACVKLLLFVLNSVQDCLPYRLKAIHVVNEPEIFHAIYNTVKHALPKKIRERVFMHGSNLEELHKYVSPEFLPEELGGSLGPIDNTEYFKYALTQEAVLEEMRNCGFKKGDTIKSE